MNRLEHLAEYGFIRRILDKILNDIQDNAMKDKPSINAYAYMKEIQRIIHNKDEQYQEYLLNNFYRSYFDRIKDSPSHFDIWHHYFPNEWKVTRSNITDERNNISSISLNSFLDWAIPRLESSREESDFALDEAIRELFPDVDPISWATILIFLYTPYEPENRVKSVVESNWTIGKMSRVHVRSSREEISKDTKNERNSVYELASMLFEDVFSLDNLERYIDELRALKCDKGSTQNNHKLRLLYIFTGMLEYLRTKNDQLTKS
jgi:hypothetical protein